MRPFVGLTVALAAIVLAGCGGKTTIGSGVPTPAPPFTASVTNEFAIPTAGSAPTGIVNGPDGALWFTEQNGNRIGRMTVTGAFKEYVVPTLGGQPSAITVGPDGNLWFTESAANKIAKITPAGTITEYAVPTFGSAPVGITAGPDGNLWFVESNANKVGTITTAGVVSAEYPTGSAPLSITAGFDGALWYTEPATARIGRISTSGSLQEFPVLTVSSGPATITRGPDDALWFTEVIGKIGRISVGGTVTEYASPGAGLAGITAAADGNLYAIEGSVISTNHIDRITTSGTITQYAVPTTAAGANMITPGPDNELYFTETSANKIGRFAFF
ncbi:MAG: Virginiamycin B lyase [Candidatus Eremiobacteraeota bacterium]|nr:Virginiamycin B lyase [Candidatus Eremiobacteraeota bacterium]